jgi:hypothetical protein
LRDIASGRRSAAIFIPFNRLRDLETAAGLPPAAAHPMTNGLGLGMDSVSYHAAIGSPSGSGAQALSVILERLCPY